MMFDMSDVLLDNAVATSVEREGAVDTLEDVKVAILG
jgi:hypothetical protein